MKDSLQFKVKIVLYLAIMIRCFYYSQLPFDNVYIINKLQNNCFIYCLHYTITFS